MARMHALESFRQYLREKDPTLTDEQVSQETEKYRQILSKKL